MFCLMSACCEHYNLAHYIAAATAWCDCNTLDHMLVDKNIFENVSQVIAKCAPDLHRWRHYLTGQADRHLSSTMWPASLSLLDITAGRIASYLQQVI